MNEQLAGQLDLNRLFDPATSQDLIDSLSLHGATTARIAHAVCATIGSPRFDDKEVESAAREAGAAAGFLHA